MHPVDPHGVGGPLELTQDEMYREVGELYLTRVAQRRLIAQLRAEIQSLSVVESSEQEGRDADGKP